MNIQFKEKKLKLLGKKKLQVIVHYKIDNLLEHVIKYIILQKLFITSNPIQVIILEKIKIEEHKTLEKSLLKNFLVTPGQ